MHGSVRVKKYISLIKELIFPWRDYLLKTQLIKAHKKDISLTNELIFPWSDFLLLFLEFYIKSSLKKVTRGKCKKKKEN